MKDFERTLDYLQTRPDLVVGMTGYCGMSEGGIWAPLLLTAAGGRIKAGVLHLGGFYDMTYHPQVDVLNYVTRVKTPILMLNGRYDTNLTLNEEVEPMFRLLGTPARDKELRLYDTDHFIPKGELTRETLAWFDKYLGVVR